MHGQLVMKGPRLKPSRCFLPSLRSERLGVAEGVKREKVWEIFGLKHKVAQKDRWGFSRAAPWHG